MWETWVRYLCQEDPPEKEIATHCSILAWKIPWMEDLFGSYYEFYRGFPCGSDGKASAYNAGDPDLIPGSGRSSGEGNGNPLQYSCLEK